MATFEVPILRVGTVTDHPNADRLSLVSILGFTCVSNKVDGAHRYKDGDLIAYLPENGVIPEALLKKLSLWKYDPEGNGGKGMLAGQNGDRVKIVTLRGVDSQGLLYPVHDGKLEFDGRSIDVREGDNVADFFGITKYEAPIPQSMSGEVCSVPEMEFSFDIENWQKYPDFLAGDEVVAVEKCHGTNMRVCFHPDVNHPELFGNGHVGIASKSLGAKGSMFKNNRQNLGPLYVMSEAEIKEEQRQKKLNKWAEKPIVGWLLRLIKDIKPVKSYNKSNLYVRAALDIGLMDAMAAISNKLTQGGKQPRIDLFGEVYGGSVQSLNYGLRNPTFAAFDIAVDGMFLGADEKAAIFDEFAIPALPVLYRGPWDVEELIKHRDGKTVISGDNIREGIVVTAVGDQSKRMTPQGHRLRPFLKMVSPAYLKKYDDEATS